jgi:hypothetical protein
MHRIGSKKLGDYRLVAQESTFIFNGAGTHTLVWMTHCALWWSLSAPTFLQTRFFQRE